ELSLAAVGVDGAELVLVDHGADALPHDHPRQALKLVEVHVRLRSGGFGSGRGDRTFRWADGPPGSWFGASMRFRYLLRRGRSRRGTHRQAGRAQQLREPLGVAHGVV